MTTTSTLTAPVRESIEDRDLSAQTRYPLAMWVLLTGNSLVRAVGFAYPFLAFLTADSLGIGSGAAAVGAVLTAFGVGWAAGQLACGWLTDRIGGRATLVSTMLVAAVVLWLLAEARSLPTLLVAAAVAGAVYDAQRVVIGAAIADLISDPARRAKIDGWRYGLVNIGVALSGAIGGLLVDRVGIAVLYYINAIACALYAVVAACCLPGRTRRDEAMEKATYRKAFSDRRLVLLFASSLATLTAFVGFYAAMPMLIGACGLGASAFGCVQLANAIAVIALTPVITPWVSKRIEEGPRLDILAAAALWTTVSMGSAALAHTTAGFCAAGASLAPGEIAWFVVGAGIVHRIAPPAYRGRYHGIWSLAMAIAAVISPILASTSLVIGGQSLAAATTMAVGLTGAMLCIPLARALADSGELSMTPTLVTAPG
jgi:MFS family permease